MPSFAKPHWLIVIVFVILVVNIIAVIAWFGPQKTAVVAGSGYPRNKKEFEWTVPDTSELSFAEKDQLIRYGRELIERTSYYLGPKGKAAAITNGMNCQNCHLDAGTKQWGNNYSAVSSTYPRFRERSGTIENIYKRINDCLERSLNGKTLLDTNGREMQALAAYINWLGHEVPKGIKPVGAGIKDIPFLKRAADPAKGHAVYVNNCQRCHGKNGEGVSDTGKVMYIYPPLWGESSYTTAAGLYRISRFAGYVKENMPFDAPHNARRLTEEEAWDVAAYVNSQPRPVRIFAKDWPDITGKPVDYPFGPYADSFPETQHKYGPFEPVLQVHRKKQ